MNDQNSKFAICLSLASVIFVGVCFVIAKIIPYVFSDDPKLVNTITILALPIALTVYSAIFIILCIQKSKNERKDKKTNIEKEENDKKM